MKIIIIDDDKFVSLSLKTILQVQDDIEVLAIGESGKEAVKLFDEYLPDVVLMDIRMQDMTGLEAAEQILKSHRDAKILLLTTFSDDEYIIKAIMLGAKGYILKQEFDSIAPALRAVNNGQTVFGTEIVDRIPHLFSHKHNDTDKAASENDREVISSPSISNLGSKSSDCAGNNKKLADCMKQHDINEKELGIIELIAEGLNNKEIADELFLSEGTVRNYISTILEKTQLRDRTQLACFYYKNL